MTGIQNVPTHILIDFENLSLSIKNKYAGSLDIPALIADIVSRHKIRGAYQVHIFLPIHTDPGDWEIKRRDKLQHLGYNVIVQHKISTQHRTKADMDATMGTILGIISTQSNTSMIWIGTGDGDFILPIHLIKKYYPHIDFGLISVPYTTKRGLLKNTSMGYSIDSASPGVYQKSA